MERCRRALTLELLEWNRVWRLSRVIVIHLLTAAESITQRSRRLTLESTGRSLDATLTLLARYLHLRTSSD